MSCNKDLKINDDIIYQYTSLDSLYDWDEVVNNNIEPCREYFKGEGSKFYLYICNDRSSNRWTIYINNKVVMELEATTMNDYDIFKLLKRWGWLL